MFLEACYWEPDSVWDFSLEIEGPAPAPLPGSCSIKTKHAWIDNFLVSVSTADIVMAWRSYFWLHN